MTTIVYYRGEFAWDSRITANGAIHTDKGQKRFMQGGHVFYMSGTVPDWAKFREAFLTGKNHGDLEVGAFVVTPDKRVLRASTNTDGTVWSSELVAKEPYALGSGADHAITAIDCGRTVREAVKLAAKRDTRTGGLVRFSSI